MCCPSGWHEFECDWLTARLCNGMFFQLFIFSPLENIYIFSNWVVVVSGQIVGHVLKLFIFFFLFLFFCNLENLEFEQGCVCRPNTHCMCIHGWSVEYGLIYLNKTNKAASERETNPLLSCRVPNEELVQLVLVLHRLGHKRSPGDTWQNTEEKTYVWLCFSMTTVVLLPGNKLLDYSKRILHDKVQANHWQKVK